MRSNKKIEKIFDLKILYIDKYLTKKEKEKKKAEKHLYMIHQQLLTNPTQIWFSFYDLIYVQCIQCTRSSQKVTRV